MILGRNTVLNHAKQVGKLIEKSWGCGDIGASDAHPVAKHMSTDALANSRDVYKTLDQFKGESSDQMIADARKTYETKHARSTSATLLAAGAAVVGLVAAAASVPVLPVAAGIVAAGSMIAAATNASAGDKAGKAAHVLQSVEKAVDADALVTEQKSSTEPDSATLFPHIKSGAEERVEYYLAR